MVECIILHTVLHCDEDHHLDYLLLLSLGSRGKHQQAAITNTLLILLGGLVGRLGSYGMPVMIHCRATIMADYKESIIKLFTYDVQDMLRTNDCTIVFI